jgi:2-oxoacid:acceptor oxidoreductase gamma subunit (pyruvate/2-ketoisovalerate family)
MSGFTRISEEPIEIHTPIYDPDVVIVLDDTVPKVVNVTEGLKEDGILLINSKKSPEEVKQELNIANDCYAVDAVKISYDIIGSGIAFNTALLGALLKTRPIVSIDALGKNLVKTFGKDIGQKNVEVLLRGNKEVKG